ncbi:hypothetical protein V5799_022552 [Amblyomma americanum]|uniref:Uncharacterized protein n=1 Tax=Amblyomma americanum TaxID=6943 RepID=A0AAQ4FMG8_AMBAM
MQVPHHSTDVTRLRILMRYRGIYLDRDVFVVRTLRQFLRYEATLTCPQGQAIGNMLMILHIDSRLLKLYHETYREFNDTLWYYNAGKLPTLELVYEQPHLLNRMYNSLEISLDMISMLYESHAYPNWRDAYAMHTYVSFRKQSEHDPLQNRVRHSYYPGPRQCDWADGPYGAVWYLGLRRPVRACRKLR